MPIKDTIAAIRKEAGITQEEMARRLYVTDRRFRAGKRVRQCLALIW